MKKNLKKILALGLCLSMLGLTACGSDKSTEEETTASEDTNKNENLGFDMSGGNSGETEKEKEVVSIIRDIEYATQKKEPVSFEGSQAVDSPIFVAPVEGMTDEFIRGVDISSYIVEKDAGVVYKDFEGNELKDYEFFEFLADCGVNWVRVRVWNDPYDAEGNGYGGGNNDIEKAVVMGKLATDAGMKVLVDFHYSDFWADPAKQMVPKDWDHKSLKDKEKLITDFTTDCVKKLKDAGVDVGMIQIGNEINAGFAGETFDKPENAERAYTLMKAASAAIRAVDSEIMIAVHYANPEKGTFTNYADTLDEIGLDYDVFGISYYPYWHGTLENLNNVMTEIQNDNGKEVVVMETSYAYTMDDGDGFSNSIGNGAAGVEWYYEVSVQGQANEVRDVINTVCKAGGLGMFYWEPAWIPVDVWTEGDTGIYESNQKAWEKYGCGWASSFSVEYDREDAGQWYGGGSWDNQAMFAFDGTPLESLNVYKYVFGGTTTANGLSYVDNIEHESGVGKELVMPSQVEATMLDGSKVLADVVWNADDLASVDTVNPGEYTIKGTVTKDGKTFELTCKLAILDVNYIKNEGFEESGMSMWTISDTAIADRTKDNNKRSGDYSLKFWSDSKVVFTAEQKIEGLSAGKYQLSAFLQGGDADTADLFELYVSVNGTKYTANGALSGWLNWSNPVVDFEVNAGDEVVVGVNVNAKAGAWGAWDDFTLYAVD